MEPVVVVGASVAGVRVAQALRAGGLAGGITLVDRESAPPYDKPALSKAVLTGAHVAPPVLATAEALASIEVDYRPGQQAVGLDLGRRAVRIQGHPDLAFGTLVIATGSRARRLAFLEDLAGVHYLRTRSDALRLRADLVPGSRLVVIGGGFIGAEVASSARKLDVQATIVEASARMLGRLMPAAVGDVLSALHADNGVQVRCGRTVQGYRGRGRIEALLLDDGTAVPADVVVVGVGVVPDTDWLVGSGLHVEDGVRCGPDLSAEGADAVYAAGDAASWLSARRGCHERAEHWTSAREQAEVVAHNILHPDDTTCYDAVAYAWSEQHGVRIQHVGTSGPDLVVRRVETTNGRGAMFHHLDHGEVVAATALDAPRDLLAQRQRLVVHDHASTGATSRQQSTART